MSFTDPTGAFLVPFIGGGGGGEGGGCDPFFDPFCGFGGGGFIFIGGGGGRVEIPRPFPWPLLPLGFFAALEERPPLLPRRPRLLPKRLGALCTPSEPRQSGLHYKIRGETR